MLNLTLVTTINLAFIILSLLSAGISKETTGEIDLSGEWQFQRDREDVGLKAKWWLESFNETVMLPGTMAQNGKGDDVGIQTQWTGGIVDSVWFYAEKYAKYRHPGNIKIPFWLQPDKHYVGAAWYRKEVRIPVEWRNNDIQLTLERCHWESQVLVDDHDVGFSSIFWNTAWTRGRKPHTLVSCVILNIMHFLNSQLNIIQTGNGGMQ